MHIPSPRDGANCWVVDGNHVLTDALTWMDQMDSRTVRVHSVDELVKACVKCAIQNSKPVDFLAVFGHGTGGYQGVGAGKFTEETGTTSLRYRPVTTRANPSHLYGPAGAKIRGLDGALSPDATVLLAGCNTGEGSTGTGLLTTVSTILGNRRVQAFENAVYWWSGIMIGPLKEAQGEIVGSALGAYTISIPIFPFIPPL